ncbi:MAG: hypothetical protein DHS20C02_01800 [Micavibrio sp.]|nr:MAG: hypothetical protein DHS20C02_01800 [Micavibrio sp.]
MNIVPATLKLHHSAEEVASNLPALMLKAEKAVASILQGEHTQKKSGQGEKFWQFRDYVPGDRPQDIDWRQSGKTDHIYIRQKEWQTTQSAIFWCNKTASMDFSSDEKYPSKAETAKILTLGMALLMTRAGEQVGIFGGSRTGRTEATLHRMGETLCSTENNFEELPDPYACTLPRHCSLVQIGDFLSPPDYIENAFKKLSAHTDNGLVIQVLDPAELELPYSGRFIFEDTTTKVQEQVNHVDSIRESYKQRIKEHISAIQNICRDRQWEYHLHATDHDVSDTLMKVWESISNHSASQSIGTSP